MPVGTRGFDLCVWKSPRDFDAEHAATGIAAWQRDAATSPFEASTDVGWFYRELIKDFPDIDASSDVPPNRSRVPIVLSGDDEPPARVVAMRLSAGDARSQLDSIFGLAAKYDLILFDVARGRLHEPLAEMAAYASATFWPRGAIRAAVAGGGGGLVAIVAWWLGVPVVSGLVALAGAFMFVMAVYTFIHEGRKRAAGTARRD